MRNSHIVNEFLNSLLTVIKEHSLNNDNVTVEELNNMIPAIQAAAREKSGALSENGDRASRDVLTLLTRQMQQNGVDKDRLDEQVSVIFNKWHDSLGISEPVDISASTISDMALSEMEAIPAL